MSGIVSIPPPKPRWNFLDQFKVRGYVDWELVDDATGKVVKRGEGTATRWWYRYIPSFLQQLLRLGTENAVVDYARNRMATAVIGTSVTYPTFIALGTGTNAVAASDTALQTVSQYDGSNDAKVASSQSLKGLYTSRIVVQFGTTEGNVTIRELGLFPANDASQNMWARVNVNIAKTSSERLNVYWYIVFERRAGLAIKTGTSIAATGTTVANTDSTLTFASAVTIFVVHNNSGVVMYLKLNGAMTGSPPQDYDYVLQDGQSLIQSEEEVEVTTIHVYLNAAITPSTSNLLTFQGW